MLLGEVAEDKKCTSVVVVVDRAFGLRIRNPKVAPETLEAFCPGMDKVKLSDLNVRVGPSGEWVTMGVVVGKSESRRSANGNDYIVWRMSDLTFGVPSVKVLLFGECVRHYWKLQVGMTLLLVGPQWAVPTDAKNEVLLKLFKSGQVVELGFCDDFGYCQAHLAEGEHCKNAVNTSLCAFCPFHTQQRARQLSAARGALNCSFNLPPKKLRSLEEHSHFSDPTSVGVKTVAKAQTSDGKIFTKPSSVVQQRLESKTTEMKEKRWGELNKLVLEKPFCLGAKNFLLKQQKDKENLSPRRHASVPSPSSSQKSLQSMREFIRFLFFSPQNVSSSPAAIEPLQNAQAHNGSELTAKERAKIKRAAEILKNAPAAKRPKQTNYNQKQNEIINKNGNGDPSFGGSFTDEQIRALLGKKSNHDNEAKKAELDQQNVYFDRRQIEEQIETNTTSLTELKNCKVVTCPSCAYTSHHQSAYCKTLGHEQRTFCYGRIPGRACTGCGSKEFHRVAMKDERKVLTERERLKIKEEEKNFSSLKG
uniref:Protein MCM10 homolog n=1 Tax=Globodera rostochiensis TaxID=31243 RepID=A0A914H520_GLORO